MQRLLAAQSGLISKKRQDSVQYYRYRYNSGYLRPQDGPRKGPISFKYDANGDRISFYGNKDTPLTKAQFDRTIERYGPDIRGDAEFNWHVQVNHPVVKPKGRPSYESFDWCI